MAPSDARWCGACGAALRPAPDAATGTDAATDAPTDVREARGARLVGGASLLFVLFALLVGQAATEAPVVAAGFSARGDAARSGVVSAVTVPPPAGVAWRVPVDLPPLATAGTGVLGTTTTPEGRELVVVHDPAPDGQRVTSHDAVTGELVATTMLPLGSQPYDLSVNDGLLAHRDLATVTLVDLTTGERRWRVDQRLRDDTELTSTAVVGVSAAAADVELLALSLADGSPRWRTSVAESGRVARLTAARDTLVVIGEARDGGPFLAALDHVDGDLRWRLGPSDLPDDGIDATTVEVTDDGIVIAGIDRPLLVDLDDGATQTLDLDDPSTDPVGGDAALVVTDDGGVARLVPPGLLELGGPDGVRWQVPTVAVHLPDLATDAGAVAVTTPDGVQVHDVADGERRWAHEAFSPDLVTAGSLAPPALVGGRVFLAPGLTQPPERGGLLSLFADTGIVDWARDEDRVVPRGTPVVDRDLVVLPVGSQLLGFERVTGRRTLVVETTIARTDLAAAGGWLVATDAPRDGGDLWVGRRATRDQVFRAPIRTCAPPVVHNDVVVVIDHLGDIVARTLATGEQPWGERARGSACRPLSIAGEVLVALVDDAELLAVTLGEGATAWRIDLPAHAAGAPVVAGDQVLVPTLAGEVLAYDVIGTDGPDGPAWRIDVGGTPAGAVAVDGETVMVVTREGELVGLR